MITILTITFYINDCLSQSDEKVIEQEQTLMDLISAETTKLEILKKRYEVEQDKNQAMVKAAREKKDSDKIEAEQQEFLLKKSDELKVERAAEAKMKRLVYAMETTDKQTNKIIPVLSTYQGNYGTLLNYVTVSVWVIR